MGVLSNCILLNNYTMDGVKNFAINFESALNKELEQIPLLVMIEQKIHHPQVNKARIVMGLLGVAFFFVLLGFLDELICNLVGFVYPAYASIRAIETPQKDDDTQWLTYWVVFATFSILEYFSGFIMSYFPFFYVLKFAFLLWLLSPLHNGARIFYGIALKPLAGKIGGGNSFTD